MKKEFILKMLMLGIMIFCCLYAQEEKECKKDQKLVIVDLISGGSAEKVGIKPGDVIVTYNSKEVHCLQKLQMLKEKVEKVIGKIRPYLQRDGGDIQLVSVSDDGVVRVRLTGACKGCPMAAMTLKNSVEANLKREIPEIRKVVSV